MKDFYLEIKHIDKQTGARYGILHTPHGDVETPMFMPVGTNATVKCLSPEMVKEAGSGVICLNGAAARYVSTGDRVIIMNYAFMTPEEFAENPPRVIFVDCENHVTRATRYEKHGRLEDMPEESDGADGVEE